MRDLALTGMIIAGLIYAMRSAKGSTLVLLWIGFQRPADFSWGLWKDLPLWQIAFGIALLSNLLRKELHPKHPPFMVLYLILATWMALTCYTAFLPDRSWTFFTTYIIPITLGMWLVAATINDIEMLKKCLWVAAGSIGINGAKTGVSLGLSGGAAISDQISGFVGDNNVFGLTLCLVVAVLMGLRSTLPDKRWARMAFYAAMFAIILTIIFTKSRGALLSLGVIMCTASLLGGKPVRHLSLLAICALVFYLVVPEEFFGRLQTLENLQEDASAMGRVENWKLAWQAAKDNPLLGIGLGNHVPYNNSLDTELYIRVAHSVYFQTLGELSFVGIILYLVMALSTQFLLWSDWRRFRQLAARDPQIIWLRNLAFWMLCGFTGYLFGSAFLNMLLIEFPWYVMMFVALLHLHTSKMRATAPDSAAAAVGTIRKVRQPVGHT